MKNFRLSAFCLGLLWCASFVAPASATPTIIDHTMEWYTYQPPTPPGGRPLSPIVNIDVKYIFDNPDLTYDNIETQCKLSRYYGNNTYVQIWDHSLTFSAPPQTSELYVAHFVDGKAAPSITYYGEYNIFGTTGVPKTGSGFHTY